MESTNNPQQKPESKKLTDANVSDTKSELKVEEELSIEQLDAVAGGQSSFMQQRSSSDTTYSTDDIPPPIGYDSIPKSKVKVGSINTIKTSKK
ncbi:hypothetical protein IQ244_26840 [Nostoc sp. LEGE 06077]|uniref:hypothetical protein n=1 Tax=Nostoc sp. LEGE 06077 TaxID=915325 RepID=UPI00187E19B1|nr:hypothetical protein [Nostoc sp. LEGE 06077]MBE9210046.1 hypothetical protein [Nostoc sp. LEGE 06077]